MTSMPLQIPANIKAETERLAHVATSFAALTATRDPVMVLLCLCKQCTNAYELLPYMLAIQSYESDFKVPNAPMWMEAAKIAAAYTPPKTDSAASAPIFAEYNALPPSNAAIKQMHQHIERHGYTRATPKMINVDKEVRSRFNEELGY